MWGKVQREEQRTMENHSQVIGLNSHNQGNGNMCPAEFQYGYGAIKFCMPPTFAF